MNYDFETIKIPLLLTAIAGLSTAVGSFFALILKEPNKKHLQFVLGLSAGVMIYVSFVELLGTAVSNIGFLWANIAFFGGILFIMLLDFLIPHEYIEEHVEGESRENKKLMTAGVLTAIGLAIHNFPEGLAVFMSALGDVKLGSALAVAISIHNIPEGIAVAMPIWVATKSRKKAFFYSFISGVAEPIGAIFGLLILMPFLNDTVLQVCLAFVGGIMVFISFDELLPLTYGSTDNEHLSIFGVIAGMAIMAVSLHML